MKTVRSMLLGWILAACLRYLSATNSEPWTDLPDNMEILCPSKTICPERNVSEKFETPDLQPTYKQCCKDCSCDEPCGLDTTPPCCYPSDASPPSRQNQECMYATTYNKFDVAKYASYYMTVQSNENGDTKPTTGEGSTHNRSEAKSCGQTDVASWGSLMPVYSEARDRIYKNQVCADEDDVEDAVEWTPYRVCKIDDPVVFREYSLSQFDFNGDDRPSPCYVEFAPPSMSIPAVKRHVCYKDLVNFCSSDYLTLPTPANITQEMAKGLCESGFMSPYIVPAFGVYANIFCFMCNNGVYDQFYRMCAKDVSSQFSWSSGNVVTSLLDTSIFKSAKQGNQQTAKQQVACPIGTHDSTSCRPLSCPAGQVHNPSGKCQFMSTWSSLKVTLSVSLTPTRTVSANQLRQVSEAGAVNDWLKKPWGGQWKLLNVVVHDQPYLTADYNRIFPAVLVKMLYRKSSKIHYQDLLNTVQKTLRKQWQICLPSGCIPLNQRLAPYTRTITMSGSDVPLWYTTAMAEGDQDIIESITNGTTGRRFVLYDDKVLGSRMTVQKTQLCGLVELREDEYVSLFRNAVLFYKNQSRYLFEHEFDLIKKNTGEYVRRICLEDAGFAVPPVASSGKRAFGGGAWPCIGIGNIYSGCLINLLLGYILKY